MQIHSKIKDYYDPVLYQISSLDHFVRYEDHRKKVVVGSLPEGIAKLPLCNKLQYLFFCGSVYPFLIDDKPKKAIRYNYEGGAIEYMDSAPSFLWSFDAIHAYFKKHDSFYFDFRERDIQTAFDIPPVKDVQLASGVCYFVFKPCYGYGYFNKLVKTDIAGDLVLYPSLKDIQFYKVVDAYTAAQQIDYWLGNIFVSDVCINTQTDEQKIVAHGYDVKVSFRSESGKGKKKNEKKRS
jgi:hypothetical protein